MTDGRGERAPDLNPTDGPGASWLPGTQYALVDGLLDPAYPNVTFFVELPFAVDVLAHGLLRVVVPMSRLRTGNEEDTVVRVRVGSVERTRRTSTAPFDYVRKLPGRKRREYGRIPTVSGRKATVRMDTTVVELTTANRLPEAPEGIRPSEAGVRLLNRCLDGLNRMLGAYAVATEDHAVRPVTPESLEYLVPVEFRDEDDEPLRFGGMVTLPKATTPEGGHGLAPDEVLTRMRVAMDHEAVRHPMDAVVLWEVRARHHSQMTGDYEMALLALNVSAEVLLDAVWATHRVDEGEDGDLFNRQPQFAGTLRAVASAFGCPWDRDDQDSVWSGYVRDCYDARNDTTHEGRHVTAEELDDAFAAYDRMRQAVHDLTLATAERYPRTALLVHGPVGLQVAGALGGRVAAELKAVQTEGALAFWLPQDLRLTS